MKRSERHKLKTDEFVSGLELVTRWLVNNRSHLVNAGLLLVGASLLLVGLWTYRSRQVQASEIALAEAMKQFDAPVVREGTEDRPELSFPTDRERYETALVAFGTVVDEFGSHEAGRKASYYRGICHVGLLDYQGAVSAFDSVRGSERDLLYYLASLSLASAKSENSDHKGASELYLTLLNDASSPLPKDHLLFQLARVEEDAGNFDQAKQYYEKFVAEHPDSQLIRDVNDRQEILEHDKKT